MSVGKKLLQRQEILNKSCVKNNKGKTGRKKFRNTPAINRQLKTA